MNIKYNLITNIWCVKWWDFKSLCDQILWGETKVKWLWLYIHISWIQVILTITWSNITPLNIFYWMLILTYPLFDNSCILYPPWFKNFKMIKKINNYVIYQILSFYISKRCIKTELINKIINNSGLAWNVVFVLRI